MYTGSTVTNKALTIICHSKQTDTNFAKTEYLTQHKHRDTLLLVQHFYCVLQKMKINLFSGADPGFFSNFCRGGGPKPQKYNPFSHSSRYQPFLSVLTNVTVLHLYRSVLFVLFFKFLQHLSLCKKNSGGYNPTPLLGRPCFFYIPVCTSLLSIVSLFYTLHTCTKFCL